MRHGEAEAGHPDAARRLTAEGAAAVGRVAARAAAAGVRLDRVYHSGLMRARQTAELLAARRWRPPSVWRRGTGWRRTILRVRWCAGCSTRRYWDDPGSIALVSHLPFLDALAGRLVAGDAPKSRRSALRPGCW